MNSTRSRTLAKIAAASLFTIALATGGAAAAHAEMFTPPEQAVAEADLSIGAIPFNGIGSVPTPMVGGLVMTGIDGNSFIYVPVGGGEVTGGMVDHLNQYKGGTCHAIWNDTAIACGV